MVKKVLIIALNEKWTGIGRLPFGLHRAGFTVNALCPKKSFLAQTRFLDDSIQYSTYSYSRSKIIYFWILGAVWYFSPDLIIPGDEDTVLALHNLSNFLESKIFFGKIPFLIRKSLPPKSCDSIVLSKSLFQQKCQEWDLPAPKNIVVSDLDSSLAAADCLGYPVVLKHDTGYGGSGVFICLNQEDIRKHFSLLEENSQLKKIKRKLKSWFFVSVFNGEEKISVQQYIEGTTGQAPFCAQNGYVFAFNPMIRLETYPGKTGPATVSSGFENPNIEKYVKTVARKLAFNGFGSLEYIVEKKSGKLFIIELNPRPTPTCHISSKIITNDLCDSFYRGLNFLPIVKNDFVPYTIAMFPGEKRRDPDSSYLKACYHDVPHDDPKLLSAMEANQ